MGDDDEFKRVFNRKTTCQRAMDKVKGLVFTAINLYVIASLIIALQAMQREELQLTATYPSDRCLPFFDKIKKFVDTHSNTSAALYDWHPTKGAISRVCSAENSSITEAEIGTANVYDPWKVDGGCDVLNDATAKTNFLANCELVGFAAGTTCQNILDWHPLPNGIHWVAWVRGLSGNKTVNGTVTPRGACSIQVNRISAISNCSDPTDPVKNNKFRVTAFRQENDLVTGVLWCAVFVPWVVMALQCYALKQYTDGGWTSEDGPKLAFANRGIPGGFYLLYWACNEGEKDDRGEFPDVYLSIYGWFMCLVQDVFEGLAAPITAVLGCSLDRFPVPLLLIIVKCIKILYDTIDTFINRNETAEPGKRSAQDALEAAENAAEAAWKAKKDGTPLPQQQQQQPGMMMQPANVAPQQQQQYPQQGMMMQPMGQQQPQPMMMQQQQQPQAVFQTQPAQPAQPMNQV